MRILFFLLVVIAKHSNVYAQYAPQAGIAGSTAIDAGSSAIVGWASDCQVTRGYLDIADPSLGSVTAGSAVMVTGVADGGIVSLGDSGVAVVTFPHALYNGAGADFAVFENGFADPANNAMAFLELAYVEVSSDGVQFFRFPCVSNTQTNVQIPGSGVYMDASLLNNLAGKYIGRYGTPFDLQELTGIAGLNVNAVTHVRIVDVTGSIAGHSGRDGTGRIINDPYPTNFPTGGFDLDAVAALHEYSVSVPSPEGSAVSLFPNPTYGDVQVNCPDGSMLMVKDVTGRVVEQILVSGRSATLQAAQFTAGVYYITIHSAGGDTWVEKLVRL